MGSWECDIGASNAKRAIARKTEKKKHFLFLFAQPFLILDNKWWDFSHSICSQIQTVPIPTRCLCLLCRGKGHAHIINNTGSRLGKRLLSKGISQKPFLTDDRYKENLPSLKGNFLLVFDMCGQYCFPANRIVPSRARGWSLPTNRSTLLLPQSDTLDVFIIDLQIWSLHLWRKQVFIKYHKDTFGSNYIDHVKGGYDNETDRRSSWTMWSHVPNQQQPSVHDVPPWWRLPQRIQA